MFFERPAPVADVIVAPTFTNEVWEGNDKEDIVDPSIDKSNENDDSSDSEIDSDVDKEDTDDEIETNDENVSANSENNNPKIYKTRSGRESKAPTRLIEEMGQPKKITNEGAKVLTSIWAMKKKPNGDFQARLTA